MSIRFVEILQELTKMCVRGMENVFSDKAMLGQNAFAMKTGVGISVELGLIIYCSIPVACHHTSVIPLCLLSMFQISRESLSHTPKQARIQKYDTSEAINSTILFSWMTTCMLEESIQVKNI